MERGNLFADATTGGGGEVFQELVAGHSFRLERIVSRGHTTPPGEWLEQDRAEWVVLLKGSARLPFQGDNETATMRPGDYLLIPAHQRHRVEWTAPNQDTVWLALHHG